MVVAMVGPHPRDLHPANQLVLLLAVRPRGAIEEAGTPYDDPLGRDGLVDPAPIALVVRGETATVVL